MTGVFVYLIACKGVVIHWQRIVISIFSSDSLMRLNRLMRCPLLLNFFSSDMSAYIVCTRAWDLIALVLTGISKVGLLTNRFELVFLLGPIETHVIVIG